MTTPMTRQQVRDRLDDARRHGRPALLDGAQLAGADLRGLNLGGAFLQGAHLAGADLGQASLSGAYLQRADLRGANLQEADLQRANLREANLTDANLQEANLQEAQLGKADVDEYRPAGRESGSRRISAFRTSTWSTCAPRVGHTGRASRCCHSCGAWCRRDASSGPSRPTRRSCRRHRSEHREPPGGYAGARYDDGAAERHP